MAQKQPEKYTGETEKNLGKPTSGHIKSADDVTVTDWITTQEARKISGFSEQYLRRLIRSGKLNGRKFGILWQVDSKSFVSCQSQ